MNEAEIIEQSLVEARAARARGHLTDAWTVLGDVWPTAAELGPDHPLTQRLAWRRSKLAHDLGHPVAALEALEPLLAGHADPFEHYPSGLQACATLATAYWDQVGYGAGVLRRLWLRCSAAWEARGDPYLALHARVQLAWDYACAGDGATLRQELERFADLLPQALDGGPTRHPSAPDAASSVPWLQLDVARTALRAATWSSDTALAERAEDVFEEAAEDAGLQRDAAYWFLEPMALVRLRLGRRDPDRYVEAWWRLAPKLQHPRAVFHRALAQAELDRHAGRDEAAARGFLTASREAQRGRYGPEWVIDPAVEQARIQGEVAPQIREMVRTQGVRVFTRALEGLKCDRPRR